MVEPKSLRVKWCDTDRESPTNKTQFNFLVNVLTAAEEIFVAGNIDRETVVRDGRCEEQC